MDVQKELENYTSEKMCEYERRTYSVRDNGSIYRHSIEGHRFSRLDNTWTFGNKDEKTGYMIWGGIRIHRIVATAFWGKPEDPNLVVDHIDTNRCNNRPENLHWVTRLENALNNPYTRQRVIYHCGSVEAFLKDPSILRGKALEPNISWMRTVTKEEASNCLKNHNRWVEENENTPKVPGTSGTGIREWIFSDNTYSSSYEDPYALKPSLTLHAYQLNWSVTSEFPLCPNSISETPLHDYLSSLREGEVFCRNNVYESKVMKVKLSEDKSLIAVLSTNKDNATGFALAEISFMDNHFIHKSKGSFFTEEGAEKYFTLSLGKEWTGGDVFEDYC